MDPVLANRTSRKREMGREEIVKETVQDSEKSEVGMSVQVVRENIAKE